jgi:hypothetical protein
MNVVYALDVFWGSLVLAAALAAGPRPMRYPSNHVGLLA